MSDAVPRDLLDAVRRGDSGQVSRHLATGADPNSRDPGMGMTALMIAAGRGAADVVRLLLEHGADVHTTDTAAGATALHKAVQGGDLETVRLIVEAGAFIDAVTPTTGHTPLLDALWYKRPDIVGYLLDRNAGLNLSTHYGFSMRDHFEYELNVNQLGADQLIAAEELVRRRMEADEQQVRDQRLMAAVTAGDIERVRRLIDQGAEVDARYPVLNGFNDGHTPLLVAARDGHTEIVRLLVAAGADVNATEPTFGAVPLHKAVYNGHVDITRILVDTIDVDLDFQGATNGYTPLHDALWHGYEECARVLLASGARLDLVGHDGKTPYQMSVDVFGPDHPLTEAIRHAADYADFLDYADYGA